MKLIVVAAFAVLGVLCVRAEAGPLPKPASLVGQQALNGLTHFVRADARPRLPKAKGIGEGNDRYRGLRTVHFVRGGR